MREHLEIIVDTSKVYSHLSPHSMPATFNVCKVICRHNKPHTLRYLTIQHTEYPRFLIRTILKVLLRGPEHSEHTAGISFRIILRAIPIIEACQKWSIWVKCLKVLQCVLEFLPSRFDCHAIFLSFFYVQFLFSLLLSF